MAVCQALFRNRLSVINLKGLFLNPTYLALTPPRELPEPEYTILTVPNTPRQDYPSIGKSAPPLAPEIAPVRILRGLLFTWLDVPSGSFYTEHCPKGKILIFAVNQENTFHVNIQMNQPYIPQDQLLECLFENPLTPIAFLDTHFNFIRVNEAYAAADEKKPDFFKGKNHFELYPSQENERIFQHVLETGNSHHAIAKPFEYELNPERGVTHWDWILTPVKNEKGVTAGILLKLRDVSEYIQAQSIAEHEQKFSENILHASGDLLVVLDSDGYVIRFNKACEILTGYKAEEIVGTLFWDNLVGKEDMAGVRADFDELVRSGMSKQHENFWHAKNGDKYRVRWSNTNLKDHHGNVTHVISNGVNITDSRQTDKRHRKSEEALQQLIVDRTRDIMNAKEAAERANERKSVFLNRLGHELRTPMNAIIGFLQVLRMDKGLSTDALNATVEIQQASEHMLSLTNEMMQLSEIEAGRINLDTRKLSVSELVSQCIVLSRHEADKFGVGLVNEVVDSSLWIQADPLRIMEVLLNILSNGIKYNSPAGKVYINARMNGPDFVQINIRDTGKGIATHEQKRIFENSHRLGGEYTKVEGSGMGLGIAKQLMELQGGNIGLQSELGKGSTFHVNCPVYDQNGPPDTPETSDAPDAPDVPDYRELEQQEYPGDSAKHFSILYVEDNPANARLVQAILKNEPVDLSIAETGEKGLELAYSLDPDLIILDLNLPGKDGFEVLAELKKNAKTSNTCIFAMSADGQPDRIKKGLAAGFSRYIIKPINVTDFLEHIRQLMEQNSIND